MAPIVQQAIGQYHGTNCPATYRTLSWHQLSSKLYDTVMAPIVQQPIGHCHGTNCSDVYAVVVRFVGHYHNTATTTVVVVMIIIIMIHVESFSAVPVT